MQNSGSPSNSLPVPEGFGKSGLNLFTNNIGLCPELWRVKYYGDRYIDDEGNHVVFIVAPRLEDVFDVVREEYDDCASFQSVSQVSVAFAESCFVNDATLRSRVLPKDDTEGTQAIQETL